jgi:diguanylate cyclase (GGDEF)-like protein/PAS domain S-box-containing protein
MLAIAKAIRDENGNPIRLPGTHTDLTFQKELESELNKQQELLHSLVRGFPDLVWLKDRDGVYLAANTRFEDFFGHPSSEIMGNTDYDFVDKDLADFFRDHDKKAIARGSPSINEETITFASDGHQETLETIKTPIHFKNGDLIGVLSVGRDITERKKAQEQLILAASVFANAHDGILICNAEVEIIDVNPVFESISGYSKDEVIGKNPRLLSSGNQSKNFYKKLWNDLKNKGFWQGEILNRRKTGEFYPILSNISCIKNNHGQITHYLSIFTDITQLKNHQKKLENLAHFDALTGLPNRVLLAERLDREIIRTKRELNMLAVCFIDLDNFKPVNDQLGHATGDDLLKLLSKRLSEFIREGDTLARIGGDEFILLLSSQTNRSLVKILAEKILKEIEKPLTLNGQIFHISASMGITLYPEDNSDPDALIRHADQAMYEAKLLGKSRIHLFDVAANEAYIEHNAFISEATQAIKENRFILYFQPKVNIKSKIIIGFEALIRWQHPQKGLLFPSDFLPTIEQHKLSYDLDLWVLDQALSQLEDWRRRNFDIVLSINITPNSLLSEVFIDELERKLKQHQKLKPQNLEIEIVETSNFSEIETAQIHLRRLKSLGIRVAIDDFGTGASSLSYLKNLPANVVKIDQSFVFDILEDRNDLAIVEGIIQLARVFDLDVVAEGVETKEHAEILYALGCHIIQGYWIAKPIQPDLVNDFILNWQIPNDFKYL